MATHRINVRLRQRAGKWLADWYEYQAGRRVHRTETLGMVADLTERKAHRLCDRVAQRAEAGLTSHNTWSVERFADEVWMPSLRGGVSAGTAHQYRQAFARHIRPVFGALDITAVRKMDIDSWVLAMHSAGYSHSYANIALCALRRLLDEAEANEIIQRNPAAHCRLPRGMRRQAETVPYTQDEARRLCALPGLDGVMLRLLLWCGLRPGELAALRAGDVRGSSLLVDEGIDYRGEYGETKTRKVRTVQMPASLADEVAVIAAGMPHDAPLFARDGGRQHSTDSIRLKLAAATGMDDFSPRRCRATFATLYPGDLSDAQAQLGHASADTTTRHYRKAIPERLVAGVEELARKLVN